MGYFDVPEIDYDRYSNRQLAAVPLAVLAVALLVLAVTWALTGAPVALGIEFAGGTELTLDTSSDQSAVEAAFEEEPESIQTVREPDDRYIVQFSETDETALSDQAEANLEPLEGAESVVVSTSSVTPGFGAQAQQTAILGLTAAFLGMSALAFVLFRTFVPSIAIVVSAFSDIMIPLAFMNLVNIPLTVGTVAALLMLIGYSVDSDILLNNHILRRSGDFGESTHRAMRTGVTMTVTSMVAMLVMAVAAWAFAIELLFAIGLLLFVGLAADLMNTYLLNLSLLRWYVDRGVGR